jgi:hypothetical protein
MEEFRSEGNLYNAMFGFEPTVAIALGVLKFSNAKKQIPRFRDAYITFADDEQSDPVIVIFTRTGGGNRDFYEDAETHKKHFPDDDYPGPYNADLRAIQGFRFDTDEELDKTYCYFYYDVPGDHRSNVMDHLIKNGKPLTAKEKWEAAFAALKQK